MMRRYISVALISASLTLSCAELTSDHAKTALDVGKVACIIANVASQDQTVKSVCNVVDSEADAMTKILGSTRNENQKAARQARMAACAPNGAGAADAGP